MAEEVEQGIEQEGGILVPEGADQAVADVRVLTLDHPLREWPKGTPGLGPDTSQRGIDTARRTGDLDRLKTAEEEIEHAGKLLGIVQRELSRPSNRTYHDVLDTDPAAEQAWLGARAEIDALCGLMDVSLRLAKEARYRFGSLLYCIKLKEKEANNG